MAELTGGDPNAGGVQWDSTKRCWITLSRPLPAETPATLDLYDADVRGLNTTRVISAHAIARRGSQLQSTNSGKVYIVNDKSGKCVTVANNLKNNDAALIQYHLSPLRARCPEPGIHSALKALADHGWPRSVFLG